MPYTAINITMEAISLLVVLTLFLLQMGKQGKTRQDKLFLMLLLLFVVQAFLDMVAWGVDEKPGAAALVLAHIANFLLHTTSSLTFFLFFSYLLATITPKTGLSHSHRYTALGIGLLSVINLTATVLNLWNGMYYRIDSTNYYHWGPWHNLPFLLFLLQLALLVPVLWHHRKTLSKQEMRAFISYGLLPGLASILAFWQPDLMLVYPPTALALMLIYVDVQKAQETKLALTLAESRTAVLFSQIQPHFLYNTLEAIQDLCEQENAVRAENAVKVFSKYLRDNLYSLTHTRLVPFPKELEHTKNYLLLEQMRFGERTQAVFDIQATDFDIPSITLQPIVENAVRHGITKRGEGGVITIRTREEAGCWQIVVEDDGVGFQPDLSTQEDQYHIGIENVRLRLHTVCGGKLHIASTPGLGSVVTISIPRENAL